MNILLEPLVIWLAFLSISVFGIGVADYFQNRNNKKNRNYLVLYLKPKALKSKKQYVRINIK